MSSTTLSSLFTPPNVSEFTLAPAEGQNAVQENPEKDGEISPSGVQVTLHPDSDRRGIQDQQKAAKTAAKKDVEKPAVFFQSPEEARLIDRGQKLDRRGEKRAAYNAFKEAATKHGSLDACVELAKLITRWDWKEYSLGMAKTVKTEKDWVKHIRSYAICIADGVRRRIQMKDPNPRLPEYQAYSASLKSAISQYLDGLSLETVDQYNLAYDYFKASADHNFTIGMSKFIKLLLDDKFDFTYGLTMTPPMNREQRLSLALTYAEKGLKHARADTVQDKERIVHFANEVAKIKRLIEEESATKPN